MAGGRCLARPPAARAAPAIARAARHATRPCQANAHGWTTIWLTTMTTKKKMTEGVDAWVRFGAGIRQTTKWNQVGPAAGLLEGDLTLDGT